MGIFLILFLGAGIAIGLIVSAPLVIFGAILARRHAAVRTNVWPTTLLAGGACTIALIAVLANGALPLGEVSPGSDYDIAGANLFKQGLAYTASIGTGFLLGALITMRRPLRPEGERDDES